MVGPAIATRVLAEVSILVPAEACTQVREAEPIQDRVGACTPVQVEAVIQALMGASTRAPVVVSIQVREADCIQDRGVV
jgi:hypothetical protein